MVETFTSLLTGNESNDLEVSLTESETRGVEPSEEVVSFLKQFARSFCSVSLDTDDSLIALPLN